MLISRRAPTLKCKAFELPETTDLPQAKKQAFEKTEHFRFLDLPPGK
jgi:hypothetical protein